MSLEESTALEQLKNLPLTRVLSEDKSPLFSFGPLRIINGSQLPAEQAGDFELLILCHWRIVYKSATQVGSGDYFADNEEWWGAQDESVPMSVDITEDKFARLFLSMSRDDLTVSDISVDSLGGFVLSFRGGAILEVFPNSSYYRENWRLYQADVKDSDFVCMSMRKQSGSS